MQRLIRLKRHFIPCVAKPWLILGIVRVPQHYPQLGEYLGLIHIKESRIQYRYLDRIEYRKFAAQVLLQNFSTYLRLGISFIFVANIHHI